MTGEHSTIYTWRKSLTDDESIDVVVTLNDRGKPPEYGPVVTTGLYRKVADGELRFHGGLLDGLTLEGFTLWQHREDASKIRLQPPTRTLWGRNNDYRSVLRYLSVEPFRSSLRGEIHRAFRTAFDAMFSPKPEPGPLERDDYDDA